MILNPELCNATTIRDGHRYWCDDRAGHANSTKPTPHWDSFSGVSWT